MLITFCHKLKYEILGKYKFGYNWWDFQANQKLDSGINEKPSQVSENASQKVRTYQRMGSENQTGYTRYT